MSKFDAGLLVPDNSGQARWLLAMAGVPPETIQGPYKEYDVECLIEDGGYSGTKEKAPKLSTLIERVLKAEKKSVGLMHIVPIVKGQVRSFSLLNADRL